MKEPLDAYNYHVPVLAREVLEYLITDPAGVYVDATAGGGGHSEGIVSRLMPQGRLVGIDRDADAIAYCRGRFSKSSHTAEFIQGEFASMDTLLASAGIDRVDGVLFDLGVSSRQIDAPQRGFSYLHDGPLDFRMDTRTAVTAEEVLSSRSERELSDLFFQYGEEKNARRIARAVVAARERKPVTTTGDLSEIVRRITPARWQVKTLSRIFQALRLEVNDELRQLQTGLEKAAALLKQGGRMVVITYHSLEDRMVKRFLRGPEDNDPFPVTRTKPAPPFRVLTKKVVTPSPGEILANPRARSAKLRAAERQSSAPIRSSTDGSNGL
jgi:16S rRNA (cytosine1402-N4)-methyltransferase